MTTQSFLAGAQGIDFTTEDGREVRIEPGEVVEFDDVPSKARGWLVLGGHIVPPREVVEEAEEVLGQGTGDPQGGDGIVDNSGEGASAQSAEGSETDPSSSSEATDPAAETGSSSEAGADAPASTTTSEGA